MSDGGGVNETIDLSKDSQGGEDARAAGVPAPPLCPECAAGKCWNCDGRTWDDVTDETTVCPCYDAGHGGPKD